MDNLNLLSPVKQRIKDEILKKEAESYRIKRQKMTVYDFKPMSIIGKGAFGEVRVCVNIKNNEVVAIKKLRKEEMHRKNQIIHVRNEKEILAKASEEWIVGLKASFQDEKYLYLVMDYLPGGDLMSQLMKKDIFTEEEGKFYMAELVLAVESVHKLNCIHRDLKPDNILIDSKGHIKLSDFGLSKTMDRDLYCRELMGSICINQEFNNNQKLDLNRLDGLKRGHKKQRRAVSFILLSLPIQLLVLLIILHLKFLNKKDMVLKLIGGLLV